MACVFVLTKNRRQNTYQAILNQINKEHPTFNFRLILMDFERFAINAFEIVYPFAKQHGCFIHFAQCLATVRKIRLI